jgi:tripartite-type tricarboxylate transporter receptor subunit TctC
MVGSNGLILAVSAKSPYHTVADIVAAAKANPGTLSYGSPGVGGTSHLSGELFQHLTGTKLIHVPNARNPAYADVIAGTTTMLFEGSVALLPHIRSGLLRPIAVTGLTRSAQLADVPTMAESGVAGFDVRSWQAIFGPSGMPPAMVDRLHREFTAAVNSDMVRQRMTALDITPMDMAPAALASFQRDEIAKWANVARLSKIEAR